MNKFLADWVKTLDNLTVELDDLGEEMLPAFFEEQKEGAKTWLDGTRKKLDDTFGEEADTLRTKLDELQLQLALGKAESRDAFEEQKAGLDTAMRNARNHANELKGRLGEEVGDDIHNFKQQMQAKMEALRLRYALGKADASDELTEVKKDVSRKVAEIKARTTQKMASEDTDNEKWGDFKDDIHEAYTHVKSAIRGLLD